MDTQVFLQALQAQSASRRVIISLDEAKHIAISQGFIKNGKLTDKAKNISFKPTNKNEKPAGYVKVSPAELVANDINKLFSSKKKISN